MTDRELRTRVRTLSNAELVAEYANATREQNLFNPVSCRIALVVRMEANARKVTLPN